MTPLARHFLLLVPTLASCADSGSSCPKSFPDAPDASRVYEVPVSELEAAGGEDGDIDVATCGAMCEARGAMVVWDNVTGCTADVSDTEAVGDSGEPLGVLTCTGKFHEVCMGGRTPAGRARVCRARGSATGRYLARMATDEALSVVAFRQLARDLQRLGAPEEFVRAALAAAQDETRHARLVAALARRHGARPPRAHVGAAPAPNLGELGAQNAAAGCVTETWSALLVRHQTLHAPDPEMRRVFAIIAADELRHAELSWAIHAWAEQAGVSGAALRAHIQTSADRLGRRAGRRAPAGLGLPTAARARALHQELQSRVWSAAPTPASTVNVRAAR